MDIFPRNNPALDAQMTVQPLPTLGPDTQNAQDGALYIYTVKMNDQSRGVRNAGGVERAHLQS